ncbi:hypothetical protein BH23VER1_BH23VER1_13470 [soil metagenome]
MPRTQSVQDVRRDLLANVLKASDPARVVSRKITFSNDDVPNFLRRLREFEAASAKVDHRVG